MGLLLDIAHGLLGGDPISDAEWSLLPHLTDLAFEAMSSGVVTGLAEWATLSRIERIAWGAAARRLELLRHQEAALVASGPIGSALSLAELDGGAALDAALVEAKVQEVLCER